MKRMVYICEILLKFSGLACIIFKSELENEIIKSNEHHNSSSIPYFFKSIYACYIYKYVS